MSNVIKHINHYLRLKHAVSVVDRQTSNGVDGPNKKILCHLKALVQDERAESSWSDLIYLSYIFFVINDEVYSETGYQPMDLMFGSEDGPYLRLPDTVLSGEISVAFVETLDANLKEVGSKSRLVQEKFAAERVASTPPDKQNVYYKGDLVLWKWDSTKPLPNKLATNFKGPYKVIRHKKNDVECRHLVIKNVCIFDVSHVKMFHMRRPRSTQIRPTRCYLQMEEHTDETELGMDSLVFTGMDSLVCGPRCISSVGGIRHEGTAPFFATIKKELADKQRTALNKQPITDVKPIDMVYVDFR